MNQPQGIQPGVYYDLPIEEYHNDPALSSSGLKQLLKHPLRYWNDSVLNPEREKKDTPAMKNGRALHTLLFEPSKFSEQFTIGKNKTSTLPDIVGYQEYMNMVDAVYKITNSSFGTLITNGKAEVSIFWRDKETGVMCRCRFDYLTPHWGLDYKSICDLSKYKRAIINYGYDISAAMYLEGMKNADLGKHTNFILLFQEKTSPYMSKALLLDQDILQIAHTRFRQGLQLYKENSEKYGVNEWDADDQQVEDLTLDDMPAWYGE